MGDMPSQKGRSSGSGSYSRSHGRERRLEEEAAARAHVGRVLDGRWEVGGRIGSGGMASVHRGMDRRLERPVAVKILHPHIAESAEARERLAREARAIAQLKHESIIEVYDVDISQPDLTWLVTELVEGSTLRRFLERTGPMLPEVAVLAVREVARALRAAHERGIIHRDVKPDNILVGANGRPKLSDFGIAKVMAEAGMTATGNLVGSPSYMSPEQAEGLTVDARTDIFSLGVVLYRLVTGTLPFKGGTPLETIRKVAVTEYKDPSEVNPICVGAIPRIIRRCLARAPDQRPASMTEVVEALGQVVRDAELEGAEELLPKYFEDPSAVEAELRPKLAVRLEERGQALLQRGEEARGLDCLARAAALDERGTTDLVRQLSRARRGGRHRWALIAGLATTGFILLAGFGFWRSEAPLPAPVASVAEAPPPPAPPRNEAATTEAQPAREPPAAALGAAEPEPRRTALKAKAPAAKAAPWRQPRRRPRSSPPPRPAMTPAPEPAAPEAEPGVLHVGTSKWVDIWMDGERLGRAPERSRYTVTAGRHRLEARKPGSACAPFQRQIEIEPGRTTRIRVQLDCPD